jgi:hypothetical protein
VIVAKVVVSALVAPVLVVGAILYTMLSPV